MALQAVDYMNLVNNIKHMSDVDGAILLMNTIMDERKEENKYTCELLRNIYLNTPIWVRGK